MKDHREPMWRGKPVPEIQPFEAERPQTDVPTGTCSTRLFQFEHRFSRNRAGKDIDRKKGETVFHTS